MSDRSNKNQITLNLIGVISMSLLLSSCSGIGGLRNSTPKDGATNPPSGATNPSSEEKIVQLQQEITTLRAQLVQEQQKNTEQVRVLTDQLNEANEKLKKLQGVSRDIPPTFALSWTRVTSSNGNQLLGYSPQELSARPNFPRSDCTLPSPASGTTVDTTYTNRHVNDALSSFIPRMFGTPWATILPFDRTRQIRIAIVPFRITRQVEGETNPHPLDNPEILISDPAARNSRSLFRIRTNISTFGGEESFLVRLLVTNVDRYRAGVNQFEEVTNRNEFPFRCIDLEIPYTGEVSSRGRIYKYTSNGNQRTAAFYHNFLPSAEAARPR